MSSFPRASRVARGYDVDEVDAFFAQARLAYERLGGSVPGPEASTGSGNGSGTGSGAAASGVPAARAGTPLDLSALDVREASFPLARHGYDVAAVDAALARLEDAVARHEREVLVARSGREGFLEELAGRARVVTARLRREDGDRFARAGGLHRGYHVGDVDALCRRLRGYFDDGEALAVDDVRTAVFRSRRGRRGYAEAPVDALLARAVEVMVTAPD
ncbi:DivIVA domain-containing protein [uncultured Pseudokineococcus sp.]|uniref:DivIVA domain-containing protein n=1 Tax=uncultured Pseudokineococcus sp. TaxID=1642928 RepID=UPI0026324D4C|nr:DivIVA domain-containing protein [uncultured Pseudokineococcus sp.]